MAVLQKSGDERVIGSGIIFELAQQDMTDGVKTKTFEKARRAPGVRLILADLEKRQIILTKEHRYELGTDDFRLPGGKVFDSLEEFREFRASGKNMLEPATAKVREEALEEAGFTVGEVGLYKVSTLGATVEWDLYVFVSTDFTEAEQQLGHGENIESVRYGFDEVRSMILDGKLQEERIALILLQWLHAQGE